MQSGDIIHPDESVLCVGYPTCVVDSALQLGSSSVKLGRTRYPVGRYRYVDHQVKNGFLYFFSVTAFDSTGQDQSKVELNGRACRGGGGGGVAAVGVEREDKVWVVPNPYRGVRNIQERPSAWDLTPNASDPHGDAHRLPRACRTGSGISRSTRCRAIS
jgi:hypothetical protein